MKRVFLFLITNIAVLVVLSIVLRLLGIERILDEQGVGLDYRNLLAFSAVFGMGGSFISLLISKWMAKRATGARVITEPRDAYEQQLFAVVSHHAQAAGIGMPEVAIYESPDPNAFATGASRNRALVAVSSGLLQQMNRDEVDAVLGHEISHIANGDMITLTLIQGVVNTFVLFLSRVVGFFVDRVILKNERGLGLGYFVTTIVAQIAFGILASVIVSWFSRRREFRADAGGAALAGRPKMIAALEALQRAHPRPLPEQMAAFGISGARAGGWRRLFLTHPPLEERIRALRVAA
jgi:heat shock protein HtpX